MHILTRRAGETIVIDHDIEVTFTLIRGNQVKLSIEAPKDADIIREELLEEEPGWFWPAHQKGLALAAFQVGKAGNC